MTAGSHCLAVDTGSGRGDVGRAVAAIARSDFPYSTGEVFHIDGGFHIQTL